MIFTEPDMNEQIAQQLKGITAFIANKGLAPAEASLEAQERAHEVQQSSISYLIDKQIYEAK